MGCVIDELTERIYRSNVKGQNLHCTCGMGSPPPPPSMHKETCVLYEAGRQARCQANDQLYGDIDIPPCHNTGRPKSREGEQALAPSPPADERELMAAIKKCENEGALNELCQQYCRDRWVAKAEVAVKQELLDDVAADRREITLQLGDAVIELERLKERYGYVREHREDLVAVAEMGKRYLEQIKMNPGLQARFDLAIKNYNMEPEDKPEGTPNEPE